MKHEHIVYYCRHCKCIMFNEGPCPVCAGKDTIELSYVYELRSTLAYLKSITTYFYCTVDDADIEAGHIRNATRVRRALLNLVLGISTNCPYQMIRTTRFGGGLHHEE